MSNFFRKRYFILLVAGGLLVTMIMGCSGNNNQHPSEEPIKENLRETEDVLDNEVAIKDTGNMMDEGSGFTDPFVDGTLSYTVESCNVYRNLDDAGIIVSDLLEPHNNYYSQDIGEKYQTISDFVKEDGSIVETHQLVVVVLKVQNEDAVGMIKKNEFSVSGIALRGGKNVSLYNPAYFSEAGKVDAEQPFYYSLEQGQTLEVKLAYLVLKEDIENLVGVVRDTDIQFSIK